MICVVIKGPSYPEAYKQISHAMIHADIVELRLDEFFQIDRENIQCLRRDFTIPMIFTLRSLTDGGYYAGSELERLAEIQKSVALHPEYLDLESHVPRDFFDKITIESPTTKIILSYHNFNETPKDLDKIYNDMQKTPANIYKIAVQGQNSIDAMRLVAWAKNKNTANLIAVSMGKEGQISRVLGPLIGNPITYASLEDQENSLGQVSAKILDLRYRYKKLSRQTSAYGLIGNPIELSIGDIFHNEAFDSEGLDAIYIKINVKPSDLPEFLQLARQLPFRGLSVTMPLKECIIPYLDEVDEDGQEIGAVNTLLVEEGRISGFNTDGIGALNAIERHLNVYGKRMVIIGTGGASRAIAYEALKRGAVVMIVGRDEDKAQNVASSLGVRFGNIHMPMQYDILVNTTPSSMPIMQDQILPKTTVMDITTVPQVTELIAHASKKECDIIFGYEMFCEQAKGQQALWRKESGVTF